MYLNRRLSQLEPAARLEFQGDQANGVWVFPRTGTELEVDEPDFGERDGGDILEGGVKHLPPVGAGQKAQIDAEVGLSL